MVKADVSKEKDVKKYVEKTVEEFDRIDIFFNNAGIEGEVAPITEQDIETLDKVYDVNIRGVFLVLKHVLKVMEAAEYQVRVNSIHPSPVNTRMMRSLEDGLETDEDTMAQGIPLGRYAESDDIANLVLFLASDESEFITGAQYTIDGGMGAS